jgi:hypothetical protein
MYYYRNDRLNAGQNQSGVPALLFGCSSPPTAPDQRPTFAVLHRRSSMRSE